MVDVNITARLLTQFVLQIGAVVIVDKVCGQIYALLRAFWLVINRVHF